MESIETVNVITREELKGLLDTLGDDIDNLFSDPPKDCILEKEVDKKVIELIEKLLKQRENFQKIYRTSNGSYYFTLKDGTTLRFKFVKEKNDVSKYAPQDLMDETIFISQEQYDCIKEKGFQHEITGVSFIEGSIPFEVRRRKIEEPVITLNDSGGFKIDGQNLYGYHFGHPVTEIIKY